MKLGLGLGLGLQLWLAFAMADSDWISKKKKWNCISPGAKEKSHSTVLIEQHMHT